MTALQNIPLAAYPLGAGLLVTSSFLFGNVGLSLVGPLPIIKGEIGTIELSTKSRLRIWRLFFDEAAFYVLRGTPLTMALHLAVPFLSPSPLARNLAIASAVWSALVIAYTGAAIQPTNKSLIALDDREVLAEAEDKEANRLIAQWDRLHKGRFLMYGGAWAAGLGALIATLT
ncbi:hypothetical protein NKR23_g8444 [Pleurostoma richardsiae]|uniref:DUF1772-domain-containing protein n=1 Tax=Pleurostoma richardsiae TaxID=41990 RepID=A0AA38RJY7_9PEZI|nr:hypothetical protein NKR23_g8444 [Pleurostoma richardsiae]